MIVMFGDHWPSLDWGFFSELVGQDFGTLDLFQVQETYKTPYIIWTNYPSESTQENMSSNYLGSYILEQAGLEMTVYNKFLLQLKENYRLSESAQCVIPRATGILWIHCQKNMQN